MIKNSRQCRVANGVSTWLAMSEEERGEALQVIQAPADMRALQARDKHSVADLAYKPELAVRRPPEGAIEGSEAFEGWREEMQWTVRVGRET